jgi:glutathione S-transferase
MLEEAGCAYERVLINIYAGAQSDPAYRAINPMMKVPALTDGDACVAESAAICAFVAERVPQAGLAPPVGDPVRGRYLHWLFFAAGCIEPAFAQKMTGLTINPVAAGWGDFDRVVGTLETGLTPGPWILGEEFSAADVMLGSDIHFGVNLLKVIEPRPVFVAYLERCAARPAFQRAQAIDAGGT